MFDLFRPLENEKQKRCKFGGTKVREEELREYFINPKIEYEAFD